MKLLRYLHLIQVFVTTSRSQATNGSNTQDGPEYIIKRSNLLKNAKLAVNRHDNKKATTKAPVVLASLNRANNPSLEDGIVVCDEGQVMSPDCDCIPDTDPCSACPTEYACVEDSVNGGVFCLDCACGACNSLGDSCCVR